MEVFIAFTCCRRLRLIEFCQFCLCCLRKPCGSKKSDLGTGTGVRVGIRQEDREAPSRGILRNDGRQNVQPQTNLDGVSSGSPVDSGDINNAQGLSP
jgi:hypothetical protein